MIDLCVGGYDDFKNHKKYTPNKCIHVLGPFDLKNINEEVRVVALKGVNWDLLEFVMDEAQRLNERHGYP